ncbi:hypothetical protein D0Y65_018265 [Glycine soja]|uniref:Uncharacterized protein n=1 Tax=Glycine soja TaxID=3848 RepID=A0A445JYD5_GLYSO|nr:hypothetical protein D0Y65_018265 [Glycine soja]
MVEIVAYPPPKLIRGQDVPIWAPTPNDTFSISSAYELIENCADPLNDPLWKSIGCGKGCNGSKLSCGVWPFMTNMQPLLIVKELMSRNWSVRVTRFSFYSYFCWYNN